MNGAGYLFVSHTMQLGGIETLLVRMTSAIAGLGYPVTVAAPAGPMVSQLHPAIRWIPTEGERNVSQLLMKEVSLRAFCHVNIWASLPVLSLELVELQHVLWKEGGVSSSCVSGIFHPAQIARDPGWTVRNTVARMLQMCAPAGSVYFMNDATRDAHVERWGQHLGTWPVHRLALAPASIQWQPHPERPQLRVVSVGRLVSFKAYNWGAISVCEALRAQGIEVSWDIWGDGEGGGDLQQAVDAAGLRGIINFRGELPYSSFSETIVSYDVFVGMGTAALEAAALSMPTILAIVSSPRGTYGFLSDAPSDSVGEPVSGATIQDLASNLIEYAGCAPPARLALGKACQAAVTARAGEEPAPYETMFAAGYRVPHQIGRSVGYRALASLRRMKRLFLTTTNWSRSASGRDW